MIETPTALVSPSKTNKQNIFTRFAYEAGSLSLEAPDNLLYATCRQPSSTRCSGTNRIAANLSTHRILGFLFLAKALGESHRNLMRWLQVLPPPRPPVVGSLKRPPPSGAIVLRLLRSLSACSCSSPLCIHLWHQLPVTMLPWAGRPILQATGASRLPMLSPAHP